MSDESDASLLAGIRREVSWKSRLLFFDDGSCIALFNNKAEPDVQSVLLSASGEFVYVSTAQGNHCHLTRFTPARFLHHVQAALAFRNRHAIDPFLCERFHPSSSGAVSRDDVTALWPSIILDADVDADADGGDDGWDRLESIDGRASVAVCPYGKRVRHASTALFLADRLMESGHRGPTALQPACSMPLAAVYAASHAPPALVSLLHYRDLDRRGLGHTESIRTSLPHSFAALAPDSTRALAFFQELAAELTLLRDGSYPTVSDSSSRSGMVVTVERVDGGAGEGTYCLSGAARFLRAAPGAEAAAGLGAAAGGDVTVDCWINAVETGPEGQEQEKGYGGAANSPPPDESMVLSLRGDFFTLHCPSCPAGLVMHISLLHFDDSFRPDASASAAAAVPTAAARGMSAPTPALVAVPVGLGASAVLWALRPQARRLITLRSYLESSWRLLPARTAAQPLSTFAVDCLGCPCPAPAPRRDPLTLTTHAGRFAALYDLDGRGGIVSLRGRFADRCMLSLCLQTKTVSAVLADGRAAVYMLQACLEASNSDAPYDLLTAKYTKAHTVDLSTPPPVLALHVRSLLAFYRYASASPGERDGLLLEQGRAASVGAAAAMQAQRFLLIGAMQAGGAGGATDTSHAVPDTHSSSHTHSHALSGPQGPMSLPDASAASSVLRERLLVRGSDCAVTQTALAAGCAARAAALPFVYRLDGDTSISAANDTANTTSGCMSASELDSSALVDPRLSTALHHSSVRALAKRQMEACRAFLSKASQGSPVSVAAVTDI